MVEALKATFDAEYAFDIKPKDVGIEYGLREEQWPFILVEFNPREIGWPSLMPDEYKAQDGVYPWRQERKGKFSGSWSFMILALSSEERDRLLDAMIQLILMGKLNDTTKDFFDTIENHDLIHQTLDETSVDIATSVGEGVPWDTDRLSLTYEATVTVSVIGQFEADNYVKQREAVGGIDVTPEVGEQVTLTEDGLGAWTDV